MNKLEANLSLFAITFFAAIQYAFLTGVPDDIPQMFFTALTYMIGFVFAIALFSGELFRLNKKVLFKSSILALELLGFNCFMLMGSVGVSSTVCSCVLSAYFVFVAPMMFIFFKKKTSLTTFVGIVTVLVGLLLIFDAKFSSFLDIHVLYLVISGLFFAIYVITVERFASKENPSILAMGQMFFGFLFSSVAFSLELIFTDVDFVIPREPEFWGSAIFVGVFIKGIYTIVEIYAQRYISAINTSLIFSTEIIMTLISSPAIFWIFGIEYTPITFMQIIGGVLMVIGVLLADSTVIEFVKRRVAHGKK